MARFFFFILPFIWGTLIGQIWDGDATDLQLMNAVCENKDVVVSDARADPDPRIAHALGTAAKEQGVRRVVWVAGVPDIALNMPVDPDIYFEYRCICLTQRYT